MSFSHWHHHRKPAAVVDQDGPPAGEKAPVKSTEPAKKKPATKGGNPKKKKG